jgi:hypothetical protein
MTNLVRRTVPKINPKIFYNLGTNGEPLRITKCDRAFRTMAESLDHKLECCWRNVMNRRLVISAMVLSVSMLGTQAANAMHINTPVHAAVNAKAKMVKFSVRNDSSAPIKLKAGDDEMSIAPGKTADMKVAQGTQIIALEAQNREAGSVVATVSDSLSGNTLVVR